MSNNGNKQSTVWLRIYPVIGQSEDYATSVEITPKLHGSIYPTEKSARAAAEKLGGVVMQVVAESLRGQIDYNDILLSRADENPGGSKPTSVVSLLAIFGDIAHQWDSKNYVAEFEESVPWFDKIEKVLAIELMHH